MSISALSSANTGATTGVDSSAFLKKMFARLDGDSDGKVTQDEFSTAMEKRFGKAAASGESGTPDAAAIFKSLDADEDGAINIDEFKSGMDQLRSQRGAPSGPPPPPPGPPPGPPPSGGPGGANKDQEDAEKIFDKLDTNQDGTVSIDELIAALKPEDAAGSADATSGTSATASAEQAEFEELFKALDGDGDGAISKDEFTAVIEQLRKDQEAARVAREPYRADGSSAATADVGENLSVQV